MDVVDVYGKILIKFNMPISQPTHSRKKEVQRIRLYYHLLWMQATKLCLVSNEY